MELLDRAIAAKRQCGLMIASRWPLTLLPLFDPPVPFPELVLSVALHTNWGPVELHNVHIPNGSQHGCKKIKAFESVYSALAHESLVPRVLCGDFNSPQAETPDGQVITWGQCRRKDALPILKPGRERWDQGERSVIEGLAAFDLKDTFRAVHGYAEQQFS